jgi:UDP-glucuronate 4-epimerase
MDFIRIIEKKLGKRAIVNKLPLQPGDVPESFADSSELYDAIDFRPKTPIEQGVHEFIDWYIAYHHTLKEGIE